MQKQILNTRSLLKELHLQIFYVFDKYCIKSSLWLNKDTEFILMMKFVFKTQTCLQCCFSFLSNILKHFGSFFAFLITITNYFLSFYV